MSYHIDCEGRVVHDDCDEPVCMCHGRDAVELWADQNITFSGWLGAFARFGADTIDGEWFCDGGGI